MVVCETRKSKVLHIRNGNKIGWAKKKIQKMATLCGINGIIDTDLLIDGVFKKSNIGKNYDLVCDECKRMFFKGDVIMNVGDVVRINKCDHCPSVVGKCAVVKSFVDRNGQKAAELRFGRGRPPVDRPNVFDMTDLSVVQ